MAKTVLALVFTLIVSASIPFPVFAAAPPGSKPVPVTLGGFSLTPTISGYLFSGSEQRDPTQTYGLKVGYDKIGTSIVNSLGIEGSLNYFTTTSKADAGEASGYIFRLDATYPFLLGAKWMPFLAVGGGGIFIDSVSHADKSPLFNYGAGLKYFLEDYLAVRVDARHLIVYNNVDTRNNFEVGIGVSYYFGKERKKKPAPKQEEKNDAKNGKKTDGTAIKDAPAIPAIEEFAKSAEGKADEDKIPAVKIQMLEVPQSPPLIPIIALAPLLALESVFEPLFQVEAPQGSVVEKPVLREVSPAKIETVSTPVLPDMGSAAAANTVVTGQSSPAKVEKPARQTVGKRVVSELTVRFDSDSSSIQPSIYNKLRELADIMKNSADATARIEGHTDSTGKLSSNIILSQQRAQSVRSSLIKLGVAPDRISTVGYGPSRPIADNATVEGRRRNRRTVTFVTLVIYE